MDHLREKLTRRSFESLETEKACGIISEDILWFRDESDPSLESVFVGCWSNLGFGLMGVSRNYKEGAAVVCCEL